MSSSSSTDSEDMSDLEMMEGGGGGFGCEPGMARAKRMLLMKNSGVGGGNIQSQRNNFSNSQRGVCGANAGVVDSTFQERKYNSGGLKISYVDSLPLARTNPVPQEPKKLKNKKTSTSGGGSSNNGHKKKSISKFKKDNCTVS